MAQAKKTPVSVRLTSDELGMLEMLARDRFKGSKTTAIVEGLRALESGKRLTKAQLMAEIDRRLK